MTTPLQPSDSAREAAMGVFNEIQGGHKAMWIVDTIALALDRFRAEGVEQAEKDADIRCRAYEDQGSRQYGEALDRIASLEAELARVRATRTEVERECIKRGHLTAADLKEMQAQARGDAFEEAARFIGTLTSDSGMEYAALANYFRSLGREAIRARAAKEGEAPE